MRDTMNATITTADLIGQYIKLRAAVETKSAAFEESLKPYREAMQALEGEVTRQINEMNGQSIKTEQGTAYRTTVLAVKVADRESFLTYVLESENYGFLTNHVSKEAVQEHIAKFNTPPPGVDVAQIHKTNFRKAS